MFKQRFKNPVFLFYILVGYIVVQFSWWLYLIFSLYEKTYTEADKLEHKIWMLIGEGSVFLIILFGGVLIIRRSIKKERAVNELQQNFLQSVSHELKTPVASLRLFLETLEKRELSKEKKKDIYQRSLGEINRLNHLISDILTARNIESDNYFIHKDSIQLDQFLKDKIDTLQNTLLKDYKLQLNTVPVTIKLDKDALTSILHNILENASKYAPKESIIKIDLLQGDQYTILEISDEGKGIDDEQKKIVFEKFYRAENEMTRKSKGTGLGLYITKFLVEKQGGTIELKDNKPTGLKVDIKFEHV